MNEASAIVIFSKSIYNLKKSTYPYIYTKWKSIPPAFTGLPIKFRYLLVLEYIEDSSA